MQPRMRIHSQDHRVLKNLERQLEEQKNTINTLMQMVQPTFSLKNPTQQIRNAPYPGPEGDLLEEIKSIKRQIQRIENGPIQNQMYQPVQPQVPMFIPQFIPQPQPSMQFYHYYPPQFPQQRDTTYKKILLELLKHGKINFNSNDQDDEGQSNVSSSRIRSRAGRRHKKSSSSNRPKDTGHSASGVKSQTLPKQPPQFTEEQKKILRRKLKAVFWYVYMGFQWKKFLVREWVKRKNEFFATVEQKLEKFDEELNYKEVLVQFVIEANKQNKLLTKNWGFVTDKVNVPTKVQLLLTACSIILDKLPIMTRNISDEHREFIRQTSLSNGYMLIGHPKFVVDRLQMRLNLTLGYMEQVIQRPMTDDQSKMVQMDYFFNQIFLVRLLLINEWYSQYAKIPNYKEGLKLLVSILQQLFLDSFEHLPVYGQDLPYNKSQVVYCDFNQNEFSKVVVTIDDKHSKFQPTTNSVILGLFGKEELKPALEDPRYQALKSSFKDFYDDQFILMKL